MMAGSDFSYDGRHSLVTALSNLIGHCCGIAQGRHLAVMTVSSNLSYGSKHSLVTTQWTLVRHCCCGDAQGQDLAVMTVSSRWVPNKPKEAKHCYGTTSIEHPAVQMISMERGKYYLGESSISPKLS